MALRDELEKSVKGHSQSVGLAESPAAFQCATWEYYKSGVCQNKNPKLNGRNVEPEWCCNLYSHDGMKVIVA